MTAATLTALAAEIQTAPLSTDLLTRVQAAIKPLPFCMRCADAATVKVVGGYPMCDAHRPADRKVRALPNAAAVRALQSWLNCE